MPCDVEPTPRRVRHSSRLAPILLFALLVPVSARAQQSASQPWWERISFGGDLRLRYEPSFPDNEPARHRGRFRARLNIDARPSDELRVRFRLASGDTGNPISTNQTFTGFGVGKPLQIDYVYLTYQPKGLPGVTLGGGRYPQPYLHTEMVWDNDLMWEGLFEQWSGTAGGVDLSIVGLQAQLNESRRGRDSLMLGVQGQLGFEVGGADVRVAVSDYRLLEIDPLATAAASGDIRSRNSNLVRLNPLGQVVGFQSEFNLVDLIGEATLDTGREGYPIVIAVDLVKNTRAATNADTGWLLGAEYGEASAPGQYRVVYQYGHFERDAVVSPFIMSDMPYGTDARLHYLEANYRPQARTTLEASMFWASPLGPVADQSRPKTILFLLDIVVRF